MNAGDPVQPTLTGLPAPRRRRPRAPRPLTAVDPVARVLVDRGVPHLDRPFEYAVPEHLADDARPGVRVRVRFGGQDLDGYLLERASDAGHDGELVPLRTVVSPEVVLPPDVLALARTVAQRHVGTTSDVLRLAIPPRHARTEAAVWPDAPSSDPGLSAAPADASASSSADDDAWTAYLGGPAFLRRLRDGESPRAVWDALPGPEGQTWADAVAAAVVATRASGRGAVVVVPSASEILVVAEALGKAGVPAWEPGALEGWVRLAADDGPAQRYRSFLAVLRGVADVVVGTRAAAFAPVRGLGLAVCWDDGHHLHAEPRAPYPHVRDVLAVRAEHGAALLVGGHARTTSTTRWVADGWARPLSAVRQVVRRRTPRVSALTSSELADEGPAAAARLPNRAWRAIGRALERGPVLVQVPRAGYVPTTACATCRTLARCPTCAGPLGLPASAGVPQCRWCGRLAGSWSCPECGSQRLRSVRVGSDRTAEELGRAFPGVRVRVSASTSGEGVLEHVSARPVLVVATPGAEPVADGGYGLAVLLDAAVASGRPELDAGEQALRTWLTAAALVRPVPHGEVLLIGDGAPVPTQALVRWDPAGFAERELAERAELRLPPAVQVISVEGPRDAVVRVLAAADLPAGSDVLGPLAVPASEDRRGRPPVAEALLDVGDDPVRALVRSPWPVAEDVAGALGAAVAARSARREAAVRVRVDPENLL